MKAGSPLKSDNSDTATETVNTTKPVRRSREAAFPASERRDDKYPDFFTRRAKENRAN
jgi:hypothetical protein